jgi:hypothetical protein
MTRWVVVGGGTAGCVVAANLATGRPDDEVLLVEAGPDHPASTPADGDVGPYLTDPSRLWSVPVAAPAGTYLQGFGLGGASLVNAGVVVGDAGRYRHRLPLGPCSTPTRRPIRSSSYGGAGTASPSPGPISPSCRRTSRSRPTHRSAASRSKGGGRSGQSRRRATRFPPTGS